VIAIENVRLFEETQRLLRDTQQRNAELAIINSVQEGLASKLDFEAIIDLVGDKIRDIFDAQSVAIGRYDHVTGLVHYSYVVQKGRRIFMEPTPFAGMSKHMIKARRTLVINENAAERLREMGAIFPSDFDLPCSTVYVPLLVGETVTGVINIANLDREHAFSESDVRLLQTLANSMSVALENARLFDEVQTRNRQLADALERQTATSEILSVIARSPTDVQPVLEAIAESAARLSGTHDAVIAIAEGDFLRVAAHYGDIPMLPGGAGIPLNRESVAGRAILEGRPLQAVHNQSGAETVPSEFPVGDEVARRYGYGMTFTAPLMREGSAIGCISIRRIEPELLTEQQIELVQAFADQAVIAIENTRLFNETQRLLEESEQRAAELAVINSVQQGLAAQLDMQAIYDLVGDKMREIFDADVVQINIYDRTRNLLSIPYCVEKGERHQHEPRAPVGFREHVLRTRQTLVVNEDVDRLAREMGSFTLAGQSVQALIFVPLLVGDEVIGIFSLQNIERERKFTPADVRLLTTLASSMSIALENARLFDEVQARNRELAEALEQQTATSEVLEIIAGSPTDAQPIFDAIVERAVALCDGNFGAAFREQDGMLHVAASNRLTDEAREMFRRAYPRPLDRNAGFADRAILDNELIHIPDMERDATAPSFSAAVMRTLHSRSLLHVPLVREGKAVGAIAVARLDPGTFSEKQIQVVQTFASQAVIALENARLFQETQRRAREMAALAEVGRDISATLDLPTVLGRIANHARELLGSSDSAVFLPGPDDQTMQAVVALGSIAAQVKAFVVRRGVGIVGDLWQRGQAEVLDDASNDPRSVQIAGTERQTDQRMMVVPLLSGARVTGMMAVWRSGGDRFRESDLNFLEGLARQAAVALENARLYSEAGAARAAAEEANQSKSAFLANVSHELRTPLTSILGFTRLVQKRLDERVFPHIPADDSRTQRAISQTGENLDIILAEGERLTTLINNVLDLEKIEAGKMEWHMQPLSIAEVVTQGLHATAAIVEQAGLALVEDVPGDLPPVVGDRDKLVQVMINLMSNAVKFTQAGAITCRAALAGDEVRVSVQDTGIGIRTEDLPLVFEKFKQVGDTLTDKPRGTGLGLPICKEIVERHGGRIWVESTLGVGSVFTFALPLSAASTAAEIGVKQMPLTELLAQLKRRIRAASDAHVLDQGQPNGRKTILVADDDANIRALLRQELSAEGYEVFEASNGREALAQIKSVQPNLVILDVMMPELSGFDVAAVVKNDPETMGLPIVILSVLEDKERGYRLGVDRYLTKPIDVPALLREVGALLAQGASRRKVLVVDEDAQTVKTLSDALRAQGYEVTAVSTGKEGIAAALSDHPDMIIVNAFLSKKHDMVQAIRFEKGLENVLFLLVQ
jgi:signal transduction histidine kinase/DNA-binding response OmpR family regulator